MPHPQRLQTAMSLYSQSLSALVLLVDDRMQSQLGIKKGKIFCRNIAHMLHGWH